MSTAIAVASSQLGTLPMWALDAMIVLATLLVLTAIVLRPTLRLLFDAFVRDSSAWTEIDERLARRDELSSSRVRVLDRDRDDFGFGPWIETGGER